MSRIDYLLIGHLTADLLPDGGRVAGGTVTYAARAAHAFGSRVGVLTSAAPDDPLLDTLKPYAEVRVVPALSTTTYENIYTPTGRRQVVRAVAADITPADLPDDWRDAGLIHLAPIAGEGRDPALLTAFSPDTPRLLTLQGWLRQWDNDGDAAGRVRFQPWHDPAVLRALDVVVFSEEDVRDAPEMIDQISAAVPHLFVTQAERGGLHYQRGVATRYATPEVAVVDPTGAGDVFAAALLAAYGALRDWPRATAVAAHLAAISVTRPGPNGAPTRDEVLKWMSL
jgi:sugar/nucleoside kinase (ribokinase family)